MTTDVILLKPVAGLGAEGDKVAVRNGYARNFLLPQGIATLATRANVRQMEELKKRRAEREAQELESFREQARKIATLTLSIPVQTGPGGKLFGAITTHHITEALAKENLTLDHRRIELKHPIHALGTFEVEVRLHPEVVASLKFSVVSANAPGTETAPEAEARGKGRRPRHERPRGEEKAEAAPKAEKVEQAGKPARPERKKKKG
jgi:large subunit ribosomal protein L9